VEGTAFLSVNDNDKANLVPIARGLAELGFRLLAPGGTGASLPRPGVRVGGVVIRRAGRFGGLR